MEKSEFLKEVNEFKNDLNKLAQKAGQIKNNFGVLSKSYFAEVEHKTHEAGEVITELIKQFTPSNVFKEPAKDYIIKLKHKETGFVTYFFSTPTGRTRNHAKRYTKENAEYQSKRLNAKELLEQKNEWFFIPELFKQTKK
jgi:hypothetical protein